MIILELQQNSLLREDMTDDNLADFLSSTYNKDKNNMTFQRLNKLMFVEIPLVLCGGDNGLTQLSNNSVTWGDYTQHYTYGLEALVILIFETQLSYLTGEMSNDPQDLETVSHSDTSTLSPDGVQKRKGGRPKNKQGFCPKKHTKCKTNVLSRRIKTSEWFGWYGVAVKSIVDQNQSELDRLRGNGGEGENSPENSAGNGVTLDTQGANVDEVSPEREYMEIELRMYNELQAKNVNKRAKISEDEGDISSSEDFEYSNDDINESGEKNTDTVDHLLVTARAAV
jgi:hypothetical protein